MVVDARHEMTSTRADLGLNLSSDADDVMFGFCQISKDQVCGNSCLINSAFLSLKDYTKLININLITIFKGALDNISKFSFG